MCLRAKMMPTLPFDIIALILLMLPTDSLVRFQCVCRAWFSFIRDPMFIKKHIQERASKGNNNNNYILYVPLEYPPQKTFKLLCDKTFDLVSTIQLPFDLMLMDFLIVGSCNGLLCLADTDNFGTTLYMCNPFIRKCRAISFPITDDTVIGSSDQRNINIALGFGYCDETDDYNIVRIDSLSKGWKRNKNIVAGRKTIDVYSLATGSWKNKEVGYFPWEVIDARSHAFVNESMHWKAIYRDGDREDVMVIFAFHLGNESFGQLSLPNYDGDGEDVIEHLSVIKGNLSLFLFHLMDWNETCHLWVMKEYGVEGSWTKTHSITIDPGVVIPLVFTNNDEIIFEDAKHGFIVYDFKSKTTTILGIEEEGYLNFVTYKDSLVMLED